MRSLYETLGVQQNASQDQIKAAYKNRARQLHPDKGGTKEDMQRLNEAYKLLTNPESLKKWESEHPEDNEMAGFNFLTSDAERPSERYRRIFRLFPKSRGSSLIHKAL
jgi:curved DNA-binding protein CbpA